MSTSKFIIPLSAVFLTAGLATWTEPASGQKCATSERRKVPSCLVVEQYLFGNWKNVRAGHFTHFDGGRKEKVRRYRVRNNCEQRLKLHEDIANAGDRGYKVGPGETIVREAGGLKRGVWKTFYNKVECCDVETDAFHYTCPGVTPTRVSSG